MKIMGYMLTYNRLIGLDLVAIGIMLLILLLVRKKTKSVLREICKGLIISCGTFLLVGMFTSLIQYENNKDNLELTKKDNDSQLKLSSQNEPLILDGNPKISQNNSSMTITFNKKQGTVLKAMGVLFSGKDGNAGNGISYIPAELSEKGKKIKLTVPIRSLKFDNQIIRSSFLNKNGSPSKVNYDELEQGLTVLRLGIIIKDSKNNITSYYYIIRPKAVAGFNYELKISVNNVNYKYDQPCNKVLPPLVITNQILGIDSEKDDVSNIENNLAKNSDGLDNYAFHVAKRKDRTIKANQFKEEGGSGTMADINSNATVTSDPTFILNYSVPSRQLVSQDVGELDEIIKDY